MSREQFVRRPIIILGAPRSGTSLLGRVLASHSSLALIAEPRLTWRWGNDARSDMLQPEHATDRVIRHIRGTFGSTVEAAGRARMLEKTPSNSLRVPFVERVFPDALYVHVIRNGLEAALSIHSRWTTHAHGFKLRPEVIGRRVREISLRQVPYYTREVLLRTFRQSSDSGRLRNLWGPRIPGIQQMLEDLDPVDIAALQWRMCVEAACNDGRRLGADRYYECRLENLNEAAIVDIMAFCGLTPEPAVLDSFHGQFDNAATAHRMPNASADIIARLRWWIDPTLQWLETTGNA